MINQEGANQEMADEVNEIVDIEGEVMRSKKRLNF